MNVLAFMRAEFDVDEDRICIMGSSMGGAGALYLAVKHPHLWAAVAAGAPPIPSNSETITNFAAIRHMPVILVHGDNDALVNVGVSRRLVSYMKDLGITHEYREIPGGSHPNAIGVGAPWMISFLERQTRSAPLGDTVPRPEKGARKVRVDGEQASQLISLLSAGSDAARKSLAERQGWVAIRELRVLLEARVTYDSTSPPLKPAIHKAWGKIGDARKETPIGEAASLWEFLENLGFYPAVAPEGRYIEIGALDCMVNATARISAPRRFSCNIAGVR
jgi:hypothetical protein